MSYHHAKRFTLTILNSSCELQTHPKPSSTLAVPSDKRDRKPTFNRMTMGSQVGHSSSGSPTEAVKKKKQLQITSGSGAIKKKFLGSRNHLYIYVCTHNLTLAAEYATLQGQVELCTMSEVWAITGCWLNPPAGLLKLWQKMSDMPKLRTEGSATKSCSRSQPGQPGLPAGLSAAAQHPALWEHGYCSHSGT